MGRHMKPRISVFWVAIVLAAPSLLFAQETGTVWAGETIEFVLEDGADHTLEANQDRITESVWITRLNNGGQILNLVAEGSPTTETSPLGTRWALGTTADLASLEFDTFRGAVGRPRDAVGKDLVLHIVEEDIYIDLRFTAWSRSRRGGFAYERTTP